MSNKRLVSIGVALSVGAGVAMTMPPAIAQNTGTAQKTNVGALEEIVVTARKRKENLQDVGLSVSALSQNKK